MTVIDPSLFTVLSWFIIVMYDPTSEYSDLDVAQKHYVHEKVTMTNLFV